MMRALYCRNLFFLIGISVVFGFYSNAQDNNYHLSLEELEKKLQYMDFSVLEMKHIRNPKRVAKKVRLAWVDGDTFFVKWKVAASQGRAANNEPGYEIAAYKFQQLFLDSNEYIVPPTIGRSMPFKEYRALKFEEKYKVKRSTFWRTGCVFFVLQYWLRNVSSFDTLDQERFKSDGAYARCVAHMNVFTYLLSHKDSNYGNFLIDADSCHPKIFVVDNGLMLSSLSSNKGKKWKKLMIDKLPRKLVKRLRRITLEELHDKLGVVAQYKKENGMLIPMPVSQNVNAQKKVRANSSFVQYGLTAKEINGIHRRLEKLLKMVDNKDLVFF